MSKTQPDHSPSRVTAGLRLAALLGLALVLLSYLRLAGDINSAAFHDPKIVAQTLTEPLWRTQLGLNILLFALAQLALHLSYGAACWLLALASERAWPQANISRRQWIFVWFLLGTVWLLVANASHFPRSSLGAPYQGIGHLSLFGITPYGATTAAVMAAMVVTLLLAALRMLGLRRLSWALGGAAVLVGASGFLLHAGATPADRAGRPNVILLGIDSLRPDLTTRENAPHMRAFLDQSVQLSDAITPLARTFPSWVSILTGRHPHTTGALMNLLPRGQIHTGDTLPQLLRVQGYRAVYAIDETRFSNLDASYGFDQTATPGIGGSDFVLAWFSDTPLSNVVMNTRLGALLFPFQYANRAAFVTYDPDSFVHRIDSTLDTRQPLFLALHLTLPHWPFEWADSAMPPEDQTGNRWKYLNAVRRADQQFGELLAILEHKGLLANAVVVALSDHGEAFGADDGFLAQALPGEDESKLGAQQSGHGTSVFSPHQYQAVLGFRAYGAAAALLPTPRALDKPVSLLDIVPTILDLLRLRASEPMDGESLLPLFRAEPGAAERFADRIRYTESEYNPRGLRTDHMTESAIASAAMAYRVNPQTDRLQVRLEMMPTIMSTRQYAVLHGDSLAAAVPGESDDGLYRFVYLPLHGAHGDPKESSRLRQALMERFSVRFEDPARINPTP